MSTLDAKKRALAPWCGELACEENIKKKTGEGTPEEAMAEGQFLFLFFSFSFVFFFICFLFSFSFALTPNSLFLSNELTKWKTKQPGDEENETFEKLTGAAKSLCTPFQQPELPAGTTCVLCNKPAINFTMFGRSY